MTEKGSCRPLMAIVLLTLAAMLLGSCAWGVTQSADEVGATKATLNGIVADLQDGTATYWFEYGPTKNYGSQTPDRTIEIADRNGHPVSEDIDGLKPDIAYHYRLCAKHPDVQAFCGEDETFRTAEGPQRLSIETNPSLSPSFDPGVPDYVTRCDDGPVDVNVEAPVDTEVSVDHGPDQNGEFMTTVPLQANQAFSFETTTDTGTSTYHVRCLPNGFPAYTFEKEGPIDGPTAWKWYLVTPSGWGAIYDGNGVPIWWLRDSGLNTLKWLADGTLAFTTGPSGGKALQINDLEANVLNTLTTDGTPLDTHDYQLLPNGNYLLMSYKSRSNPTDLTDYGGPADGIVEDAELQEVKPDGTVVWTWNSKDHIGLEETGHWWDDSLLPQTHDNVYDVVHMNAAVVDGDDYVISLRHTDGIYKIDGETGEIIWKLGGTPTPESLNVLDDPYATNPLGGQHDAMIRSDGTLTAHDNGQLQGRPPRTVQYEIDQGADTARLLDSISDPDVPAAICCGSARLSNSGSWLASWGGAGTTPHPVVEYGPDGSHTFVLTFTGASSYRATPVGTGQLTRSEIRAGMDAQHPR
ncbi:MAG: aryl-sulfate sulfotransferase [Solirubrobacterales bacterium]